MKKILSIKEAFYTPKNVAVEITGKVETLVEHVEMPTIEVKMNVLLKEEDFIDAKDSVEIPENLKIIIERGNFKELFGAGSKPRKGDVLSINGLSNKFKVKKSKKFSAKKKGHKNKGYKVDLKTMYGDDFTAF